MNLSDYRKNVCSQTGEDGVLEKIFQELKVEQGFCIEFGAWDGIHFSNTRNLIINSGWSATLIEANQDKFTQLKTNCSGLERVSMINTMVGFLSPNRLDDLVKVDNCDLLSIDVDGNDYWLWNFTNLHPKVVVIEFNPTCGPDVDWVQAQDLRVNQGCSLLALVKLGKSKGYELACALPFNAIFVHESLFRNLDIKDNSIQTLWTHTELVPHLFYGYDGTIHLTGNKRLVWHDYSLDEANIQVVPKK